MRINSGTKQMILDERVIKSLNNTDSFRNNYYQLLFYHMQQLVLFRIVFIGRAKTDKVIGNTAVGLNIIFDHAHF